MADRKRWNIEQLIFVGSLTENAYIPIDWFYRSSTRVFGCRWSHRIRTCNSMFLLWRFNICLLPFSSGFKGVDLFLMSELRITFSMLSSGITFLSDSTLLFWRHLLIIDVCKYGRTSKMYEWSLLKWSATCSPIVYVYLNSFSSQFLIESILFILFMLILICSPMLSVSLEFTSSLVFDGDRLAHLLFSLCVLCLFTNAASVSWVHPSPVFDGVRVAHPCCVLLTCSSMFIIFVLYGFTNVVSVSWVQHSPVLDGVCVAHLFSLSLTC